MGEEPLVCVSELVDEGEQGAKLKQNTKSECGAATGSMLTIVHSDVPCQGPV